MLSMNAAAARIPRSPPPTELTLDPASPHYRLGGTAGQPDDGREHDDAEEVELSPGSRQTAARATRERATKLVGAMTLEQKIAQLNGAMQTIDIYARTSATR